MGTPAPLAAPPTSGGRPRVWPVFVALLLAGLLQVAAGVAAWAAAGTLLAVRRALAGGPVPPAAALLPQARRLLESAWGVSAASLGFSLALGAFALALGALSPAPWRRRLRLEPSPLGWAGLALAVAGFLALSTASDSAVRLLGLQDRGAIGRLVFAFERASPGAIVLGLLALGLAAGTAEELFFRGFVQTRLVERWGRRTAIGVTALAFGVYHLDALQGAFAVAAGLWLGWLADRTGSIRPSAAAHVVNNAAWVLGTAFLPRPAPALDAALLPLSLAATAAVALILHRRLSPRAERAAPPGPATPPGATPPGPPPRPGTAPEGRA